MRKHLKTVLSLTIICSVVAVLMAVANAVTKPIVDKNEQALVEKALLEIMPNGEDFEKMDIASLELPSSIEEAYSEKNGGYIFKMNVSGYSSGMIIMCGVDSNGIVTGAKCLASSETLGYEKSYGEKVKGADINSINDVDTISGATKTTSGYKSAIKTALNAKKLLTEAKGGAK